MKGLGFRENGSGLRIYVPRFRQTALGYSFVDRTRGPLHNEGFRIRGPE